MTQPMLSPQTGPTSPLVPPTLWRHLDSATQQQLAHCICDLIWQMRSVPALIQKETGYDGDSH